MEDSQIIALFFQREETAISQIHAKYHALCENIARHILPDERDVEECVSDAYLHTWNAIPPDHPHSLQAYLARITRNLSLDRFDYNRAAQRNTALTDAFEELEPALSSFQNSTDRVIEARAFRDFLNCFLRAQSRDARIYFIRRYWYGESIHEIAAACGVGDGKVKSSLFRTRSRLQTAMEKEMAAI